jgi:hypothetical protein
MCSETYCFICNELLNILKLKHLVLVFVYYFTNTTINLKEVFYFVSEDDATFPPSRYSSIRSQTSEVGNSFAENRETDGMFML